VLVHERLELPGQLEVSAQRQFCLDPLLERDEAQLLESGDRSLGKRLVSEIGEGRTAPQLEGVSEAGGRCRWIAATETPGRVLGQTLEAVEIDLLWRDLDQIARLASLEQRARRAGRMIGIEELAELRDVPLQLGHRAGGARLAVQVVREPVDRHDPVRVQQQDREYPTPLRTADP
jgi:hypothetical protein